MKHINYRKIYEEYYGPIPQESNGRSYEIHHIDGNHSNNNPTNLIAVTLQEHFDIHYAQGDYHACVIMSGQRMNKTPQEMSLLSKQAQQKRVNEGTHNFLGGNIQRKSNKIRIQNGTHHFLNPDFQKSVALFRLSKGTHASQIKVSCCCCRKELDVPNYKKHHGEKCKYNKGAHNDSR